MERAALGSADFLRGLSQIGTFKINDETKSLLGFWRNEAQFWKSEIDENKKDIQATNKLASGSG